MSVNKFPPKPKYDPDTGPVYLYGLHTVRAALDNPRREKRELLATPNALPRLRETGEIGKIRQREVTPRDLDRLLGDDAVHQGVALEVEPVSRFGLNDIEPLRLIVVLDQVTDPHNVGAILRTACAFGADALITTQRYAPRETGVMAKAASGALDLVPLIEVRNLGDTLELLKKRGMRVARLRFRSPCAAAAARRRRAAGDRARRRGQGPAAADARALRRDGAARHARPDQVAQRLERGGHRALRGHHRPANEKGRDERGPSQTLASAYGVQRTMTLPSMLSAVGRALLELDGLLRARAAHLQRTLAVGHALEIAVAGGRALAEGRGGDHRKAGGVRGQPDLRAIGSGSGPHADIAKTFMRIARGGDGDIATESGGRQLVVRRFRRRGCGGGR